jgi:GTP-binding protein LepA
VVTYVRTFSGELKTGTPILLMGSNLRYDIKEVGIFTPKQIRTESLKAGQVGYLIANIKTTAEVKIGDTLTNAQKPAPEPLPGFKTITPMVFSGIYPIDTSQFEQLKIALGKLQLNDAALTYTTESSVALGFGFRCGFLGLLHMEIVQERLRREYQMDIIATYPSVVYEVTRTNGEVLMIDNPTQMPDPSVIESIAEPMVRAFIMIPNDNIGDIMQLVMEKRGICEHTESLDAKRVMLRCDLPLNEILVDFNDRIKSITRGYGSMDYEYAPYRISDMVKMDMLVNAEPVDAFSCIVERSKAEGRGRHIAAKLKEVIHPHLFKIAIQAAIGGKIIAREDVKSVGKNVTAKCYGGDISRKRKLLEKQKEGKKRMKSIGSVDIPQEAFIAVLKSENK